MQPAWILIHPRMTPEHLGLLPGFLDEDDPRPTREQFNENYVSGWRPFKGFELTADDGLAYPGDPVQEALAYAMLRDEKIVLYASAWVAIIQPDRSFEVCRMD